MPSAKAIDLRERVVAALADGVSNHAAATQFGVSLSSVYRWARRARRHGHVAPSAAGGDRRSYAFHAFKERTGLIVSTCAAQPDKSAYELQDA